MSTPSKSTNQERAFRDFADAYLEAGFYPIPIKPAKKKPHIKKWGKVMSPSLVQSWKQKFPEAGLGLVMGKPVNDNLHLVALDIDQDALVEPVKATLFPANDDGEPLYVAKRGNNGETIFVVSKEQLPGKKFKNADGMGVELLAGGQQTVIPPTIHPDGMPYEWIGDCELLDADLTQLPRIDQGTVKRLEVLVKGSGTATVANDNTDYDDRIGYLGGGEYTGVEMVYPGNVNDTQCKMAAVAAHHDYMTGNVGEETRLAAAQGMAEAAFEAYQRSGSSDEWSHDEQLEEALIVSDVGIKTTMQLIENIHNSVAEQSLKEPSDIKILMRKEISRMLMDRSDLDPIPQNAPVVLLVVGVNGAGKTTSIAKMVKAAQSQGQNVMLAAADTFRAGAIEQIKIWGERLGVPVIAHRAGSDPGAVAFDALKAARARGVDLLIIDRSP